MSKDFKVLRVIPGDKPELKRYDEYVPHYDDPTQLWILCNTFKRSYIVKYKGKKCLIEYVMEPGLITDKASTPVVKSDWYGGDPGYLPHDCNFSAHYLKQFPINADDGFRASNILFLADMAERVDYARANKKINGFKYVCWCIKKRVWYRSVGSIAGRGYYVNGSPDRGYHGKYSTCTITEIK